MGKIKFKPGDYCYIYSAYSGFLGFRVEESETNGMNIYRPIKHNKFEFADYAFESTSLLENCSKCNYKQFVKLFVKSIEARHSKPKPTIF